MKERASASVEGLVQDLERLREQGRAVGEVLRAVTRGEGLQPVLDEIVSAAQRLCDGEHAQLYLGEGDVFHIAAHSGGQRAGFEYDRGHPHLPDRTTVIGRVALSNDVAQIADVLADPDYDHGAQAIVGFRALLGVPIVLEGKLIGALAVGRNVPGLFRDEQVELVKTFADQAAVAIANARLLDAVERQRTELARFVSPQVAELVSSADGEQLLAGHRAYISCLFCDLRNFTAFAETAAPEDLFDVLRAYHTALGQLIPRYQGTLEHFAGDGVMIFFNDPLPVLDHELQAVRFALAAQERFAELAGLWRKRGSELALGVGIEAGYATLGRIGFEGRYDYGALGPVTNLASRLSTRSAPTQILIGPRVYAAVEEAVDAVPVGELELKGFGRPMSAYEVRGLREAC
jgi:class 3 adenylate cyclase